MAVVLGDRVDPLFAGDFALVDQVARSLRLRRRTVNGSAELDSAITAFEKQSPACTDVLIWVAAHGYPATGSNIPHPNGTGLIPESRFAQVALKSTYETIGGEVRVQQELFDSETLRRILAKHPDTTFKLVVSACFAGRWTELSDAANMRVILAGARSDQMGWGAFEDGATYATADQRNGILTTGRRTVRNDTVNPTRATTFTNGVARGLAAWSISEEARNRTGGDLAKALVEAFADQRRNNFSHVAGWAIPVLGDYTSRPEGMPPPPAPPGQTALSGSCSVSFFDPTEVTYRCSFSRAVTGFAIDVPGGRRITADLPPSGASCTYESVGGGTDNRYRCSLSLPAGQEARGNLRTMPVPQAGMGCTLYGMEAGGPLTRAGSCSGP